MQERDYQDAGHQWGRVKNAEAEGRNRSRGKPDWQLPMVPPHNGHQDITGIGGNVVPVSSDFHMEFLALLGS